MREVLEESLRRAPRDRILALPVAVLEDDVDDLVDLAGALARTTLLLLNEPAAVRWMLNRDDSPWYPSMRLLRKGGDTPWLQLLEKAAQMLARPLQTPEGRA